MSSEENKSKSEKIKELNLKQNKNSSSSSDNKEENPSQEKQIDQELESSKLCEQKLENPSIPNSISISYNKELTPSNKNNSGNTDINSPINAIKKKKFFKSKKKILFDKKENIEKFTCNCTKTKCVKKYCECFANNRYCRDCNCVDCLNKYIYSNTYNNSSKDLSENEEVFCTCAKSNCTKKYCECYKSGKKCNDKCRCINCLNSYPIFNIKNKGTKSKVIKNKENISNIDNNNLNEKKSDKSNVDLDEKKIELNKLSSNENENDNDSDEDFQIQRISVFINQYQTLVNVEKITKEDMKFISKKRLNS